MLKKLICLACAMLMAVLPVLAEDAGDGVTEIEETFMLTDDGEAILVEEETGSGFDQTARNDFIDRIIAMGHDLYVKADGKAQRAHYAGDIYVCKNFTTYLFRKNRDDFCMAEYPGKQLIIPNNLPSEKCRPYYYGMFWEEKTAAQGNPFEVAAQFLYNSDLTEEENLALACDFMRQARRGDFFQMSAQYEYGTGAHSAIIIEDYDPATDSIHWMDSNMRGKKVNGIRYGIVQYDEVKDVAWWASTFCHPKRGATLYRMREDIIYAEDAP